MFSVNNELLKETSNVFTVESQLTNVHPKMISDIFGSYLTPTPPYFRFSPVLKVFLKDFLHRESPIFENLPPALKSDIIYGRPPTTMKAEVALEILLHGIIPTMYY